jgi:hypothetical protein
MGSLEARKSRICTSRILQYKNIKVRDRFGKLDLGAIEILNLMFKKEVFRCAENLGGSGKSVLENHCKR